MPQSLPNLQFSSEMDASYKNPQSNVDNLIMILRASLDKELLSNPNPFEKLLNPVTNSTNETHSRQSVSKSTPSPLTLRTTNLEIHCDEDSPPPKSPKNYSTVHSPTGIQYICLLCDNAFKHKPDGIFLLI